jgi:ankyrin repeat protein
VSGVEIPTIILHVAAQNNQVSTIEYLLSEHKMDIDCKNYQGETPLHVAACDGHKEAVEYLLQRGAGINIQDKRGCTPLHWAAMQGHHSVVEILLAQGANCMATSQQGFTPLMLAQTQKYECAAEILLNFQKLLVAACEGDIAAIQSLVVSGVEIPTIILHVAAQNNQVSTIEYLLSEHKMDIDFKIKNANGESIWHIAAYYGIEEAIKYCLNKDIKNIDSKDGQGRTALHWAALCRRSELVEILIDSGANPTIQDKQRRTYEDLKPAVKASKKPMSLTNLRLRLSGNSMGYFATQQRSTMERCSAILKAIVLLLLASVMYAGFLLALHYLFKQLIAKDDKALNNGFDYNSEPKYNTQGTTPCLSLLK